MTNYPKDVIKKLRDWYDKTFVNPEPIVLYAKGKEPKKDVVKTAKAMTKESSGEPTLEELIKAMEIGSKGDPVATMAAQMAREGQKYPVYQKYPFLPIATSQLESSGLKDFGNNPLVTQPKQAFGWGMNVPGYNPANVDQVLKDMMSAVGSDRPGEDVSRQRNANYYAPFRETGDLSQYANTYAGPVTNQNPNAGDIYAGNLSSVMNRYAEILDMLMKERGSSYSTRY